jgi:hypothetical protein
VNPTDDQRLRQRLHEEFGAFEISPPPVLRVTGRGRGIRIRRRALAIGSLVVVLAGGALAANVTGGQKMARPTVTVSAPDPAAAGGVFASGTADGKRWALAVRNVNADPGTPWCLPAVMFNGRYGDVLYPFTAGAQAYGHPAYLARHLHPGQTGGDQGGCRPAEWAADHGTPGSGTRLRGGTLPPRRLRVRQRKGCREKPHRLVIR